MAIADLSGKYHVKIDGEGYILCHAANGRMMYEKKPAPSFVNKTSSGDSSYRDASFWQYFAQINWRNGAKQERFDDGGKFWKSSNIDCTQSEKVRLSKELVSAGQAVAGEEARTSIAWRGSQAWWDVNYVYRKQITITAPAAKAISTGYPIVLTENTATLVTASKMRSDRNDLRVVYWNGTSWVDLKRDYVSESRTVFSLQSGISAGGSNSDYYLYYGYSSESTNKQPTTDADWNDVYAMFGGGAGTAVDANTLAIWHSKEGSGTTLTDTDAAYDLTGTLTPGWATDGPFGRNVTEASGSGETTSFGVTDAGLDVGSFTIEWFIKRNGADYSFSSNYGRDSDGPTIKFKIQTSGTGGRKIYFEKRTSTTDSQTATTTNDILANDTNWHHYAIVFNGTTGISFYRDNSLVESQTMSGTSGIRSVTGRFRPLSGNEFFAHMRFSNVARTSFPYAVMPSEVTLAIGSELTAQPPASSFTLYTGYSNGKIYSWDGATTLTEVFDSRRLAWYETGVDAGKVVGDTGGTETAQSQGFKLAVAQTVKGIQVYLKKNAGTPGDITVRIETDAAGVPSGTLANGNATTTISAFTVTDYAWKEAVFSTAFALSATTLYHIVLKTAAADNDNNYVWGADASSPSYSDGAMSASTNGGTSWSAVSASDAYFRVLSQDTEVYSSLVSSIGGTQKQYWGVGDIDNTTNGDARIYSYDGSSWALSKSFTGGNDTAVTALAEYNSGIYAATAPQARIYSTADVSTWAVSKQIRTPQNPGYVYALREYNYRLYAGGGSPEYLDTHKYNGFLYYYDGASWNSLYPFEHTVVTALGFYDAFLFIGTYHGQVYIYDTSTLDPLINFADDYDYKVKITNFAFYDDKIFILLSPQDDSGDTNSALWIFERHGISVYADLPSDLSLTKFVHGIVVNNALMLGTDNGYMFKVNKDTYSSSGWLQQSYFDALLPSINKLHNQLIVQTDPIPNGGKITVYYKYKESDSWTELGEVDTEAATATTLDFPTGTYSKKISFKYLFETTDSSVSPVIKESVLKYTLMPDRKWQWNMRLLVKGSTTKDKIILLDKSQDSRTSATLRGTIEGSQATKELVTYIDVDGTQYTVLFNSLDEGSWVVNNTSADYNETSVSVTLLEA